MVSTNVPGAQDAREGAFDTDRTIWQQGILRCWGDAALGGGSSSHLKQARGHRPEAAKTFCRCLGGPTALDQLKGKQA